MKGKYWYSFTWCRPFLPLFAGLLMTLLLIAPPALASRLEHTQFPPATPVVTCLMLCGDLGDAPVPGMTAYPSVTVPIMADFPTIYFAGTPSGPFHHSPEHGPHLGAAVTLEQNAHQLPDEDGVTNINLVNDIADKDGADDGVSWIRSLEDCESNSFNIYVTVPAGAYTGTMYLNVWFDFERDGDWNDVGQCGSETVSEWAVRNRGLQLTPGAYVFTASVAAYHPEGMAFDPLWMRITLGDMPAPVFAGGGDGRGPAAGYLYGETEDYFLRYHTGEGCPTCASQAGWQG